MRATVKTGIKGVDAMLYGGIPEGNQIVVAGGPGAGKTLLSFEYLYRNAKEGVPGLFLALEESPSRVIENAKAAFPEFTDIDELISKKLLLIDGEDPSMKLNEGPDPSTYEFGKMIGDIEYLVTSINAKRVVIDSISLLDSLLNNKLSYRRSLLALVANLRKLGTTSLFTVEIANPDRSRLKFKPEFFLFDGIFAMYQTGEQDKRALQFEIIKMRGTKHSFVTTPYEITSSGVRVISAEEL